MGSLIASLQRINCSWEEYLSHLGGKEDRADCNLGKHIPVPTACQVRGHSRITSVGQWTHGRRQDTLLQSYTHQLIWNFTITGTKVFGTWAFFLPQVCVNWKQRQREKGEVKILFTDTATFSHAERTSGHPWTFTLKN